MPKKSDGAICTNDLFSVSLNKKDEFWNDNGLGSMMLKSLKTFLRHAEMTDKNKITNFGRIVASLGGESAVSWALMICNLVYTPQFNWWVMNIDTNRKYTHKELDEMLKELLTDNSRKNVISGFKNIFCTNPVLGENLGFGFVNVEKRERIHILLMLIVHHGQPPILVSSSTAFTNSPKSAEIIISSRSPNCWIILLSVTESVLPEFSVWIMIQWFRF